MPETKINGNQINLGEDCVGAFVELTKDVNDGKKILASALTTKGVEASSSDSLVALANKVNNIIPEGDTQALYGKMWFSGYGTQSCYLIPVDQFDGCLVLVQGTNKIYLVQNGTNFSTVDTMASVALWEYDISEILPFSTASASTISYAISRNNQHLFFWSGTTFYRFSVSVSGMEYVTSYTSQEAFISSFPFAVSNDARYILYPTNYSSGYASALIYDTISDQTYTPTTAQWQFYRNSNTSGSGYRLYILDDLSVVGYRVYYNSSGEEITFSKLVTDENGAVTGMESKRSRTLSSSLGLVATSRIIVTPDNKKVFYIAQKYHTTTPAHMWQIFHYIYNVTTYEDASSAASATSTVVKFFEAGSPRDSYNGYWHQLPDTIKVWNSETEVITFDSLNVFPNDIVVDTKNHTVNIGIETGGTVAYGGQTFFYPGSWGSAGGPYYYGSNTPVLYSSSGYTYYKGNRTGSYSALLGNGDYVLFYGTIGYIRRSTVNKRFGYQVYNTAINDYQHALYTSADSTLDASGFYDL